MMQTKCLKELRHEDRFSLNALLSSQIISLVKTLANFGNHVMTISDTYSSFILNLKDRSLLLAPGLRSSLYEKSHLTQLRRII